MKVLDFGLARVADPASGPATADSPTFTSPAMTAHGVILGTAAYMAPEQARGRVADARSDLWAFGVVLYEMLTGQTPFAGETVSDVIAAVLREPIAWDTLPPDTPPPVQRLLRRCLQRDPQQRLRHAGDARLELVEEGAFAPQPVVSAVPRRATPRMVLAAGAAVVALAAAAGWWLARSRTAPPAAGPVTITPFTFDRGGKYAPHLSPDGQRVAYMWTGPNDDSWDIYVKEIGPGTRPVRITQSPVPAFHAAAAWSPDSRQLAFVRATAVNRAAVYIVPSLGGQERKVTDIAGNLLAARSYFVPILRWMPDGESIIYAEQLSDDVPSRIVSLSLTTHEKRPVTSPPPGTIGDLEPSVSPDGRALAFVRASSGMFGNQDVWVEPMGGGDAKRLTFLNSTFVTALEWTPDGSDILFSVGTAQSGGRLFRVAASGGTPQPMVGVGDNALQASVSGTRMVYVQSVPWSLDVWRLTRSRVGSPTPPEKLIASASNAAYSPDGARLAFESSQAGPQGIWASDASGADPIQLTTFQKDAGTPKWSPDGRRLCFDSLEAGNWDVYVIDADGGPPRRLTSESFDEATCSWSRDGTAIYFMSNRTGRAEIWKMPSAGGPAVQVTKDGGFYGIESPDGRDLYYTKDGTSAIWRRTLTRSDETEVVKDRVNWASWTVAGTGLYYATVAERVPQRRNEFAIQRLDLATGRTETLLRKEGAEGHQFLTVSPDETTILFGESPAWQADLKLVENFR